MTVPHLQISRPLEPGVRYEFLSVESFTTAAGNGLRQLSSTFLAAGSSQCGELRSRKMWLYSSIKTRKLVMVGFGWHV